MDVLMPDDLVGNPVEDIEDEESQRKSGPWDRVDPLGSVHKLFPHGVYVLWGWLLRVGSWNSIFNSWAILCWQTLAHVVAGKIKAAFTQIVILKSDMHMWMSLLELFKSLQLRCSSALLCNDWRFFNKPTWTWTLIMRYCTFKLI